MKRLVQISSLTAENSDIFPKLFLLSHAWGLDLNKFCCFLKRRLLSALEYQPWGLLRFDTAKEEFCWQSLSLACFSLLAAFWLR